MKESIDEVAPGSPRRQGHSLFGPIVLIAVGVYFLLANLGVVGELNWWAAFRFWPLLLIFLGINIMVRQVPRPFGTFFSALVGLTAVTVFGYLLLAGEDNAVMNRLNINIPEPVYQTEMIEFAPEGVETAVVRLDFGAEGADLQALEDSRALIAGTVSYLGDLQFDTSVDDGGQANIYLDARSSGFWPMPMTWPGATDSNRWQIGLNPGVPIDLTVDLSSGATTLDLADLTLTNLEIDASSGSLQLSLPVGEYAVKYDASSGMATINAPANGNVELDIDASSGSMTILLPDSMAARVDIVNASSGSVNLGGNRFSLIRGEANGEGVWETADYGRNDNQLDIILDMSSGSFTIR